jgi:hypothetical protein
MTQPANKLQPASTMFQARLDKDISQGRISVQQGITLGLVEAYIRDNPDGRFAELLIGLLQGQES